ncbi:CAP domain-containing protein [Bdellovibrio reynosensis]|uniref:CAP domain-containing protein n=1 Tax=Bdellovibrio reynosensis TaxID=2835041 RepID=A0ABY4CCK2_9BACT|nr:CAP domain-containing protein [Bdellovibrio reynosensis]UOF02509.1 CAP domain-containing protein [Bdellovibrio reynosensis]
MRSSKMRVLLSFALGLSLSACGNSFVPAKNLEVPNSSQTVTPDPVTETPAAPPETPEEVLDMSLCGDMNVSACQVLMITNKERAALGLPSLLANSKCINEAQYHAQDMATYGYFSHDGRNETTSERFARFGLSGVSWGENIASGYLTAAEVMVGWMNSPGHKKNIVSTYYKSLGVGYAVDSKGAPYWVQCFTGLPGD